MSALAWYDNQAINGPVSPVKCTAIKTASSVRRKASRTGSLANIRR